VALRDLLDFSSAAKLSGL